MKLDPKIKLGINAIVVGFITWAAVGVLSNAKQLASVSVELLPNGIEHQDKTLLGIVGKADQAADYKLYIRSQENWINLGTFANTPIGDGIEFIPSDSYPIRTIQEVKLLDEDKLESDVLDQGPLEKGSYEGNNYRFTVVSEFSLQAGFHWFFATPVGIAILVGIGVAVFLMIASRLDFSF